MDLTQFTVLKEKIDFLVQRNTQLREQQEADCEKLRLREGEIEKLSQQCLKYEQQKEKANYRITKLIQQLKDLGIGF